MIQHVVSQHPAIYSRLRELLPWLRVLDYIVRTRMNDTAVELCCNGVLPWRTAICVGMIIYDDHACKLQTSPAVRRGKSMCFHREGKGREGEATTMALRSKVKPWRILRIVLPGILCMSGTAVHRSTEYGVYHTHQIARMRSPFVCMYRYIYI